MIQDELIAEYGEDYRVLIVLALAYLDEREPTWNLKTPIDRREYIRDMIARRSNNVVKLGKSTK